MKHSVTYQQFACVIIALFSTVLYVNAQQSKQLTAVIDVSQKQPPIADKLFGMFIENLGNEDVGNITDDCLWAELLDDRKFFYPVDTLPTLFPKNRKEAINQWYPMNAKVFMDEANAYVGKHSPKITLENNTVSGIKQSGIALEAGKTYTGRVVLKASGSTEVTVALHYGNNENDVISKTFKNIDTSYSKYYFQFTCPKNFLQGALSITGKGTGNFHIGAVSLMPDDNIDGFRADVIPLLKNLNSSIYRWGGNFISGYDWRDGVGDSDKRAPRYEYAWECLEDNDVGTDEMIRFTELIGVELAMTVNTGFGDAFSAAQWVEYVNGSTATPMGKWRAENGHAEPYDIKLWCVGNESYGWWQLGHIPLEHHILKHNMFAEKMLEKDPTLQLIGSGASIEEMTVTTSSYKDGGEVEPTYGSETDWTGGMLEKAAHLSFMSEHFYCSVTEHFDLDSIKYVTVTELLEDWTLRPANRIKSKAYHYQRYRATIPGADAVPVYLDEWAYYTNWVHPTPTLGVTIGYGRGFNELFRHTDLFKMAGFTFGTSCLSFTDTDVDYNATGLLFKLYQSQFGRIPVVVNGNSPQPAPKWPLGGDQPVENAGGNVYPLDVVAALTEDGTAITVSIINPTEAAHELTLDFLNTTIAKKGSLYTLSGTSIDAVNVVNKQPQVTLQQTNIKTKRLTIQPATINIVRYELK
ncbi:carbohydrate binding domain-containing protein [Neptunitalea lumnitzerae]|uniref:non-reducing end alpha-L-arabinofuranosidase n=1 Tax=Neptunitalea lumnitzerae TaxID=2965509 RepID=A0ABQ5MFZ8_9FLAO|nr:carbohydrate binding domain-containing protein [Neptunitalea sp. Y10]GLB48318.1 hypothetical protein Y10_06860 [Neptunitalea sp. Y10]